MKGKGLKIVAFVVGGIVVLLAVVVALALTPSVQTWAVRKAVAGQPGMTVEVGRVDAGFSAANITDLRYAKDGVVVTAKGVTARYSAWDYISSKRINADAVSVQDLLVDLRGATKGPGAAGDSSATKSGTEARPAGKAPQATAKAKEKKTPFEGVLKQAQLPFDVRVASLDAKGRALLPNEQSVVFDLKGAGIETGQKGKIEWTIDFADAKANAALRALRSTGTAGVHISNDRRIDLIEVETIAAAMGPKLPADRLKLTAKLEQPAAGANEGYSAVVALLRGTAVEPLVKTNAQYLTASREITGAWEIAVRSEQLAALLAGLGLPPIAANGAGKFSLKPDTNAVAASGNLQGQASELQKLSPALEAIGTVQFKTTFDGGLADNVGRLEKLQIEVTGNEGRKFAEITTLQRVAYGLADQKVTLANPRAEVARIALQQLPLAWAQPVAKPMVIESGDLSMVLAVEAEPDGSRIRARATEPLAVRNVTVRDANKKALVEQVTLTLRPSVDYAATKISAQLAELSVTMPTGDALRGNVSAEVTNFDKAPAVAFAAQLQGKIVALLKPYLPVETGPLATDLVAEGRHEGQTLTLAKARTVVTREGGAPLLTQELLQAAKIDLKTNAFVVANPAAPAARVKLGEVPLAWAEPFVAKSKLGGALTGGTIEIALRSLDDVTLNTIDPITLRGVTAQLDGKPMAQNVDLTANLTATKRGETIAYELRRAEVKQADAALATLTAAGEAKLGAKATIIAKGNLDADVAALMKQPALAEFATLSRGRVTAAFDANIAEAIQAKAAITAKDLVAKHENRVLGNLDVKLNATMKPDGSGTVTAPLTLSNGQRTTDLNIDATFGKAANKETFLFTGKIASNNLVVDDLEPLAGLAPGGSKPAATTAPAARPGSPAPTPAPRPSQPPVATRPGTTPPAARPATTTPGRDTKPFWAGTNGKVEVDLKRVLYGKDYVISGVRGSAVITDSKLSLDGLEGRFKENPFKLAGGVTFAAQQPQPYALLASADVQNFDVGEFLRAANPNELPALETKATVTARLNGNGGTVGDLFKNAFGKFELTGTKGVARYLARKGGAGTAVNVLSLGLSVLGAAKGSDTTMAIAEIARLLNEVPFENVKMQVERGADLSFKLTSMEVISPIVRMTGTGAVSNKSTDDLATAPMNITLQMGAKGELAHLLGRVGMLAGVQTQTGMQAKLDEKGYALMTRTFSVGGTASKPDSSALWKILGEAALGALAR